MCTKNVDYDDMEDITASNFSPSLIQIMPFQNVFNNVEHLTDMSSDENVTESKTPILERTVGNGETTNDKVVWLEPSVKLLVSLVEEFRPKLGKTFKLKTKKMMWKAIEETMRRNKYDYSSSQIENKWKSLERRYKNKIQHNKKTGRDRASCSFEKELDNVFKGRDNIFPRYVLGVSGNGKTQNELQKEAGIGEGTSDLEKEVETNTSCQTEKNICSGSKPESEVILPSPSQTHHKKENSSIIREISLLRQEKREYYSNKNDSQSQKLRAYEQRTKEIAEKNKLLK